MDEGVLLHDHQARIEALTARLVDDYLDRLKALDGGARTKEFNDPVWGTLQIRAEEVVILDSPLMQRLRRIRQLGVVHFVYPAATHTRLEHSLGVVHQVQRLITSINDHGLAEQRDKPEERVIGPELERLLRIAALTHDVGHGALSHVSEYALDDNRECQDLRRAFQRSVGKAGTSQLSEIAAYYMLGAPAFRKLAEEAARLAGEASIIDLSVHLQSLIIGNRINEDFPLLQELISGPFDADKLDYLTRDATMCGVPVVTDVPRLIQKVRATRADRESLTPRLKGSVDASPHAYIVTGVSRSGGRTLDELALARTLMFDKVYRHQKVRSAEAMVFSLVNELVHVVPGHPTETVLGFSDEDLLGLNRARVCEAIGRPYARLGKQDKVRVDTACDLAQRLRERRLFVRGFAFASVMTDDAYRHDPEHTAGLKRFLMHCSDPHKRNTFIQEVIRGVRELSSLLKSPLPSPYADGDLRPYLAVSPPKPAPRTASAETGHAHLIDNDGRLTQVQDDAAETMPWADAYVATRDLGHIFCPQEIAPFVFLAAEAVLRVRYAVHLPESMLLYAKQSAEEIRGLKRRLAATGWYDDKPIDLRPLPAVLARGDAPDRIARIIEHLQGYSGPTQAALAGTADRPASTIRRDQVVAFVRQFGSDDLVTTALRVLERIRVIGRADANSAVERFLELHPEFEGANYCTLGEAKDSSSLLTYYIGDVAGRHQMSPRSLAEALNEDAPILFVDDFAGTGSQARDIFENYLGHERSRDLDEQRVTLAPALRDLLREHRLGLVFVSGLDAGVVEVERALTHDLHLNAITFASLKQDSLPFLHTIGLGDEELAGFRVFAAELGARLLEGYGGKERSSEWIAEKVLGYGNTGLLLTSTYNTPSATLTCLWAGGEGTQRWRPLLPRRPKK